MGGYSDNADVGAAWVYTRSGGAWSQQGAKLVGAGAVGSAEQGLSVALSADGNTAIVGGQGDNGYAGAAWVYTRSGGVWSQQGGKLVGTGASGSFAFQGHSVALSADGNTAIVGGYGDAPVGAVWVFTPDDATQGSVSVQVTTTQGKSNVVNAVEAAFSPALFTFSQQGGKYVAAVRADGTYIAPPNLISGHPAVPAKPGDTILLFGTGFGPTTLANAIGQLVIPAPVVNPVTVRIGGVTAITSFAGLVSPGEYQFNVVVPNVPNGDNSVSIEIGGRGQLFSGERVPDRSTVRSSVSTQERSISPRRGPPKDAPVSRSCRLPGPDWSRCRRP